MADVVPIASQQRKQPPGGLRLGPSVLSRGTGREASKGRTPISPPARLAKMIVSRAWRKEEYCKARRALALPSSSTVSDDVES
ncbi:hypothetical protein J1614_006087 [Plenodomus biglobosus]|nr:hypothetical protein J1614_006087 [Plenodomus biglobosus]